MLFSYHAVMVDFNGHHFVYVCVRCHCIGVG